MCVELAIERKKEVAFHLLFRLLFSVYINNLINILQKDNIGCRYGPHFIRVYGYADDISLLCPTVNRLKEMLKTCEPFAKQQDILFKSSKSQQLWFGKGKKPFRK